MDGFGFLPANGEGDAGAFFAADQLDRLGQTHVLGGFAVDLEDLVTGPKAGPPGRGILYGRHYGQDAVALGYFNADAEKAAPGLMLKFLHLLGRHKRGVGVQGVEHAANGPVDQFVAFRALHELIVDLGHYLGEYFQLLPELGIALGPGRRQREQGQAQPEGCREEAGNFEFQKGRHKF